MIESKTHVVIFTDVTTGHENEMIAGGTFEVGDLFRPIGQDLVMRVVDTRGGDFPAVLGHTLDGRKRGTFGPEDIIGLSPKVRRHHHEMESA